MVFKVDDILGADIADRLCLPAVDDGLGVAGNEPSLINIRSVFSVTPAFFIFTISSTLNAAVSITLLFNDELNGLVTDAGLFQLKNIFAGHCGTRMGYNKDKKKEK